MRDRRLYVHVSHGFAHRSWLVITRVPSTVLRLLRWKPRTTDPRSLVDSVASGEFSTFVISPELHRPSGSFGLRLPVQFVTIRIIPSSLRLLVVYTSLSQIANVLVGLDPIPDGIVRETNFRERRFGVHFRRRRGPDGHGRARLANYVQVTGAPRTQQKKGRRTEGQNAPGPD